MLLRWQQMEATSLAQPTARELEIGVECIL